MDENRALMKFAVKVAGLQIPGNWDRPLGYEGMAQFVAVYWDRSTNDVYVTDGINGSSGGAWWLFTDLVHHDARPQIQAALLACGSNPQNALGDSKSEAACALILDRYDHCLWVGGLHETTRFLINQHPCGHPAFGEIASALTRQKRKLLDEFSLRSSLPCQCQQGWVLRDRYFVPCSECRCSGRIDIVRS